MPSRSRVGFSELGIGFSVRDNSGKGSKEADVGKHSDVVDPEVRCVA